MQLDSHFVLKVLTNAHIYNGSFPEESSFSVDTRTLQHGDVFVALKGEHVDGHDFIAEALAKGASGFILAHAKREKLLKNFNQQLSKKHLLFVDDPLQALIDLAKNWRSLFTYPVVAITGSVGKTTTKEMIRNILKLTGEEYLVAFGNQNTLIGVSLNILKMRAYHQSAIFELGVAKRGAMLELVHLLRPTCAVITKIGHGHMQGLGDLLSVAQQKRDVFSCFSEHDIGIINGDQDELTNISYVHPVIKFGCKTANQIQARKIIISHNMIFCSIKIYDNKYNVVIPGCHKGRVITALAAIAVGYLLKISETLLIQGVQQSILIKGRFQILPHSSGSVLIDDSYNANPDSVKSSLLAFQAYETTLQKVVVLADMLELGLETDFWHRQLGRFLSKINNLYYVILIGKHVLQIKKTLPLGLKFKHFETTLDAYDFLKDMLLEKNKVFLFKGSNSLKISELVKKLQDIKA